MTNTSNVSDPFLATYERPTKGVVLGSLFIFNHIFSISSVAIFMWAGPVGGVLKKKFVDADRLLAVPCIFVAFINIVFTLNASSGFHKNALVVGNPNYAKDALGYFDSGPNALCTVTAFLWQVALMGVVCSTVSVAVYLWITVMPSLSKKGGISRSRGPSDMFMYSLYLFPVLWPIPWNVATLVLTHAGPINNLYCGVRCEEDYGIDGQTSILMNGVWNNPGKCFYRMVAVYGSLGLMGVGSGSTCAYVAWCLHEHASKGATPAKKNKKDSRMMAAVMKLVYFGGFVGTACFIAFVARLLPLVRPRPYAEGQCGTAEYVWTVVPPMVFFVLALPVYRRMQRVWDKESGNASGSSITSEGGESSTGNATVNSTMADSARVKN